MAWLISACGAALSASPYVPQIPDRPTFDQKPAIVTCEIDGRTDQCVLMLLRDWAHVRRYYLELEREVRASCLALGHAKAACKADAP